MTAPTLQTTRLTLTPFQADDFDAYRQILASEETARFSDLPRNPSEKAAQAFVAWLVKLGQSGRGQAWAIRKQAALIGCIRFNRIDKKAASGMIGYELAPTAWNQGFATEALKAICDYGFQDRALFRLEAWTVAGNLASERVLKKAGFRHEGTQRQKMIIAGERYDLDLHARLKSDTL